MVCVLNCEGLFAWLQVHVVEGIPQHAAGGTRHGGAARGDRGEHPAAADS